MVALMLAAAGYGQKAANSMSALSLGAWMESRLLPLAEIDDESRRRHILVWWQELQPKEIFIVNKLLTGSLRIGVSETLVYRALALALSLPPAVVAARLVGSWRPTAEFFLKLTRSAEDDQSALDAGGVLLPLPFCLAAPLDKDVTQLGPTDAWQCEWKWDGIRCQAVKRGAHLEIWSRGEERITGSFPDLAARLSNVPGDWILDGEIVAGKWKDPQPFQMLQIRLNRKKPTDPLMAAAPVSFLAYDLLQWNGRSWREQVLAERRIALEELLRSSVNPNVGISPVLTPASWGEAAGLRNQSRSHGAEGLILKGKRTVYEVGRKRGVWFKWKVDPLTVDAVLTAAQPGTGRRASLYTDYTFSLWSGEALIPIAKAYSGLTDIEVRELDRWIRNHTRGRFGPVRMVDAMRVFEIGFEGIGRSDRHKSGFAVRFPRILRERTDKLAQDANRIEDLKELFESLGTPSAPIQKSVEQPLSDNLPSPWKQMKFFPADESDTA
jgi:DNA ligase-1